MTYPTDELAGGYISKELVRLLYVAGGVNLGCRMERFILGALMGFQIGG